MQGMNLLMRTFGLGPEFAEGAVKFIQDVQSTLAAMAAEQALVHGTLKQILANQKLAADDMAVLSETTMRLDLKFDQFTELAAGGTVPAGATDYAGIETAPKTLPPFDGENINADRTDL